jgi:hypothetical protein
MRSELARPKLGIDRCPEIGEDKAKKADNVDDRQANPERTGTRRDGP